MKNAFAGISLAAVTLLSPGAYKLMAADCFPAGSNGTIASFSMVTLKKFGAGSQYASYVKGIMNVSNTNTWSEKGITFSTDQQTQLFSDRTVPAPLPYSKGIGPQPFSILYPDTIGVTISNVKSTYIRPINPDPASASGGAVTLVSYGRAVSFGVSCDAVTGELYGAASPDTFVVITLETPHAPGGVGPN